MTFFRLDSQPDLYQKLHVEFQGRRREAVYGSVSVSVVRHVHLKIDVRQHLLALDADCERYWTIVDSAEEAGAWEKRFSNLAPVAAEAIARSHGSELLERTSHARRRAIHHLHCLHSAEQLYPQIRQFEEARGAESLDRAARLAEWPGVMQVYGAGEIYLLACCAVLSGDEEEAFVDQDPLENDELMWQIQLVADRILSWYGVSDSGSR
jgi:hypothetical protein